MQLVLDDDGRPLYAQIATAVRRALAEGRIGPGDRLPAGRDLAAALGVTLATVQRAYRELADDGLVVSHVGRGTRITPGADPGMTDLHTEVRRLVAQAARLGVSANELATMVRRVG